MGKMGLENLGFDGGNIQKGLNENTSTGIVNTDDISKDTFSHPKNQPRKKFKRTIIIEPAFALFYMFYISSFPLNSQYLYHVIGERHNLSGALEAAGRVGNGSISHSPCDSAGDKNDSVYLLQQKVQAEASTLSTYLELASGIPAIIAVLFYGTLVDRYGRKLGLIFPLIGVSIKATIYLMTSTLNIPLEIVYIAHIADAVGGGMGAFVTACYSFWADTVAPENMSKRLALSDVAFGFTLAVMDVLMGILIQKTGFVWPFVVVLCGHALNMVYTVFFIPETVDRTAKKKDLSPKFVIESFKVLPRKRPNRGRFLLLFFLLTYITCGFGTYSRYSLQQLYKLNSPFCWNSTLIGLYSGVQAILQNVTQVVVALFLMKRIGEISVVQISCASFILAYTLEAFSTTDWMLMSVPLLGCFMGLQLPVMEAILSGLVTGDEQGAIFSVASATDKLSSIIGTTCFNAIYRATLLGFKGTIFLLMAGFVFTSMIFLEMFRHMRKKEEKLLTVEKDIDAGSVHSLDIRNTKL